MDRLLPTQTLHAMGVRRFRIVHVETVVIKALEGPATVQVGSLTKTYRVQRTTLRLLQQQSLERVRSKHCGYPQKA